MVVLGRIFDIDFPAREPSRQAHILAFLADGEAELIFRDQHMGLASFRIHEPHFIDPSRAERIGNIGRGIGRPADDVNFFAPQLIHHDLNSRTPRANARSYGIHITF